MPFTLRQALDEARANETLGREGSVMVDRPFGFDPSGAMPMPLGMAGLSFSKLPPWLRAGVTNSIGQLFKGGHLATVLARPTSASELEYLTRQLIQYYIRRNPLNPVSAITKAWGGKLSNQQMSELVMANSLLGAKSTGIDDLNRLLMPKQLQELKTWAAETLRKSTPQAPQTLEEALGSDIMRALTTPGKHEIETRTLADYLKSPGIKR